MAKNDLIARQNAAIRAAFLAGQQCGWQQMADAITLTLKDKTIMGRDTFGEERIITFLHNTANVLDRDYPNAFRKADDADYDQAKLDANIKAALPNHFSPFEERYPWLYQFDYKKGKWK